MKSFFFVKFKIKQISTKNLTSYKRLVNLGIPNEEQNPLQGLLKDKNENDFKEEILDDKVLSIIIEFRVSSSKLQEVLDELKKCDIKIDTVFNVGLIDKVSDDGPMGNDEQARRP